jgi:uncharacterized membrane protein YoaK (UPF0700 family)
VSPAFLFFCKKMAEEQGESIIAGKSRRKADEKYDNILWESVMVKEKSNLNESEYLECERWWIFALMMLVGGYFGAFTYSIRGGVFCNAQTANVVLFAMALGDENWGRAAYLLIPMSAYLLGAFISESMAYRIKKFHTIRWDTLFVAIDMVVVIFLGALPETAPYQITQVLINLVCSMQYNTFRQAEGVPMATTFCTNHIRQVGIHLCKTIRHRGEGKGYYKRVLGHLGMLFVFVVGGISGTLLCKVYLGKALWFTLIPLSIVLLDLLHADTKTEKEKLDVIPHGHE